MTTIPCQSIFCDTPADETIIYGCINAHLGETHLCRKHADEWLWKYNHGELRCPHAERIIDYDTTPTRNITIRHQLRETPGITRYDIPYPVHTPLRNKPKP